MNSFTDGSVFCPGAPKRVPSDSEKHRRVDTASGKTLKNGMRVYTLSDRRSTKKLGVYTASEAKGLKGNSGSLILLIEKQIYQDITSVIFL